MTQTAENRSFWESWPWRRWLGGLAGALTAALAGASLVLPEPTQIAVVQFAIPVYSYTCLGLAVIAFLELREPLRARLFMGVTLAALVLLSVLGYAVAGVSPLLILALHAGFLLGWIAWPRRAGWTWLWLVEALAWVVVALAQGRLL